MAHVSNPHPPQHVDVHVKGKHKHKHHKVKKPKVKVHKDKVCKKLSLSTRLHPYEDCACLGKFKNVY